MKIYLIPIIFLFVYACSSPQINEEKFQNIRGDKIIKPVIKKASINKNKIKLKFTDKNGQAVLIGENIDLFDSELNIIDNISNLDGRIVEIRGVSDSLFNQSKDICKAFWYVKIKSDSVEGIVNGRQVFEVKNSNQDTSFIISGNQIDIKTTGFYGMGVAYNGDLMGCPVDQPILIKDKKNNYFGLVTLIKNEYSKKAIWDNDYPFFELRNDDGCNDRITSVIVKGAKIKLKIHRNYQEGENDYEVMLNFEDGRYTAKYINFGEIKYE